MTNTGTGWERNKRTHFDEIIVNYDKVRPGYPDKLIADAFAFAGNGKNALEIGAGTGKVTAPFVQARYNVTAVEIGGGMAEFLADKFSGCDNFNVIVSSFEDAQLEDNSYDIIYAGSAFHWVDAEIGCPKAFRLLKSGGVITLFRYNVVSDYYADEFREAYEKHYFTYYTSKKWRDTDPNRDFTKPPEILEGYGFTDLRDYGFADVTIKLYEVTRMFTADEYIALCDTMADNRGLPDSNREALYAEMREIIAKHGGYMREDSVFQSYMGRKK